MAPAVAPALSVGAAVRWAAALALLAGLVLLAGYNYLPFHSMVEVARIGVAFAVFLFVWNIRGNIPDSFFLLVGIAFLFIGAIDLLLTFAYSGMGVFSGETADLATQLWLAARYFQSIAFLAAALLIGWHLTRGGRYDAVS